MRQSNASADRQQSATVLQNLKVTGETPPYELTMQIERTPFDLHGKTVPEKYIVQETAHEQIRVQNNARH